MTVFADIHVCKYNRKEQQKEMIHCLLIINCVISLRFYMSLYKQI